MKNRARLKRNIKKRAIANQDMQSTFGYFSSNDANKTNANQIADNISGTESNSIHQKENSDALARSSSGLIDSFAETFGPESKRMSGDTLSFMEHKMGYDFSNVNIHDDHKSELLNRRINAQAFTYGNDIYFGKNKFDPSSSKGKHLLAHELTHVVQQTKRPSLQKKRIQRQKEKPEWKKAEEKFKKVVVSLDPKKPKSNAVKFKSAVDKTLGTLGKKKVRDSIFKKLKLNPQGKLLLSILGMSGYGLYSLSKNKIPTLGLDFKLKPNTWLTVSTGGDFKKPKVMIGLKLRFRGL